LSEIRYLFFGFREVTGAPARWRTLSQRKLAELDQLMDSIKTVQGVLNKLMTQCRCETLDQCGKRIFESMNADPSSTFDSGSQRRRGKHPKSLRA
jgi:hypothetical protein